MPRPRKAKTEAATKTKSAATKAKSKAQSKTETKITAATKDKTKSATETPKHSEIVLEYSRFGNLGFSRVVETVDISFLTQKKFSAKITALFHFVRCTLTSKDIGSCKTATFALNNKMLLNVTQDAGDFENQVFTLTRYKEDGTKQSTRKYSYNKTKNLILQTYGFEVKSDAGEDAEELEKIEDNDTELLLSDTDFFEDDIDSEYSDMD